MNTIEVIEGLLFESDQEERLTKILESLHILNRKDRVAEEKEHLEFPFIKGFQNPNFISIINKKVYTFIIGKRSFRTKYYVLEINGNSCQCLNISKAELNTRIKGIMREENKEYLPDAFNQRIVFIPSNSKVEGDTIKDAFIFTRKESGNPLINSHWVLGLDERGISNPDIKANIGDIIKNILSDIK